MKKRMMLIGETGAGKSALIQALTGQSCSPSRSMAVTFCGQFINTPGEFLENRRFYRALITTAADCDILAMLQDATRRASLFPPKFAAMFNRRVLGVVTKADGDAADVERAERFLRNAGAVDILRWCTKTGEGLDALRAMLL